MPAVTTPHPTVKQPSFDRQLNRQLAKSDSAVEHLMQSPAYAQSIDRSVRESKHHAMAEARTNTEDIHLEPATSASVLSAQDEDIPVSLNELSESELKNVLHSLESRK